MDTRAVARALVAGSNVLLGVSLLLVLVWWAMSVRLFAAGWVLYGVGSLLARGVAVGNSVLAMPE